MQRWLPLWRRKRNETDGVKRGDLAASVMIYCLEIKKKQTGQNY